MRSHRILVLICATVCALSTDSFASAFGSLTGLVHDSQHRPISGARLTLKAQAGAPVFEEATANDGTFFIRAIPSGQYDVTIAAAGFADTTLHVTIFSDRTANLHQQLALQRVSETVTVTDTAETGGAQLSAATQMISAAQIARTPGADQANSFALITDYVPGAVMTHDQLHVRGGHQVTWMIDGVEVPNTNIASNVGPQFDPKDVASLETETGGYSSSRGDRTYGAFNVVPRSGFERSGDMQAIASYGSQNTTDNQLSYGNHTNRFAYYGSVGGNRTDAALEPSTPTPVHDAANGYSTFHSLVFNASPQDQLRFVTSARNDHFQVPNDFDQEAAGFRDTENERDIFSTFTWLHSLGTSATLTVSPFLHFNQAHYTASPDDPLVTNSDRGSNYYGGSAALNYTRPRYSFRFGGEGFFQRENDLFSAFDNGAATSIVHARALAYGSNSAGYVEAQAHPFEWLNLTAGLRASRFSGAIDEHATDPRIGGSMTIPKLRWVLHGYYGHYYQPPPLFTVADPLSSAAQLSGVGFLPLHGERDIQREFGITIPIRNWTISGTRFQTSARNYFDHDALGESNVFLPLTIAAARIRGYEALVRSPARVRWGNRCRAWRCGSPTRFQQRGRSTRPRLLPRRLLVLLRRS